MLRTDLIESVPALIERHAGVRGSTIAFQDANTKVTYAELANRTANLAGHLADFGVDELVPFLHKNNVKLEDS